MSSILDALDRAEQERRRDHSISIGELSGHSRRIWNRQGFWIIAGILLLGNLLVWLLVWRSDTPVEVVSVGQMQQTSARPQPVMTKTPPIASARTADIQGVVARQSPASIEEQLKRRAQPGVRPLIAEAMVKNPPLSAEQTVTAVSRERVTQPDSRVSQAPDTVPVRVESIVEPEQSLTSFETESMPDSPVVGLEASESTEQQSVSAPAQAPVMSEWESIPSVWEVSDRIRMKVEGLKISVHVYNTEPGERFVIINKRRYREGDTLEDASLKLKRIAREGIVIDYGDGEVRM